MLPVSNDPDRFEAEIKKYEKEDARNFPPQGTILFTGSSTIRKWKSLQKDMSPLPIINRGFGGSWIQDAIYFFEQLVVPYAPKGIVFYSGENDIANQPENCEISGNETKRNFEVFYQMAQDHFPTIPVFYVSIKPPKKRIKYKVQMNSANNLIKKFCDEEPYGYYIDIVPILSEKGRIKKHISNRDGVHLNKKGYKLITSVIKPILLSHFE